jgi:hypothetical protein
MFRTDTPSASRTLDPTTPVVTEPPGPNGEGGRYFTDGADTAGGTKTLIQSEWLNMIQEELVWIIKQTGGVLIKDPLLHPNGPYTQLATAVRVLTGADDGTSPETGTGSDIDEPEKDALKYSRFRLAPDPDPHRDGDWVRAIDEPLPDGFTYNRVLAAPPATYGTWRRSGGQSRLLRAWTYYVRKDGSNANAGTTPATAWATIQYAVDTITRDLDANGNVVTVDVGPSNEGDNLPWAGFAVTRPLVGAPPFGFKIIGQVANPAICQLVAMPKRDGTPGLERYSVYVNNAKIAISGFAMDELMAQGVGFCADENCSEIALDGAITFPYSGLGNAGGVGGNVARHSCAQALRGGTILVRGGFTVGGGSVDAGQITFAGNRIFYARSGGKILFSEGALVERNTPRLNTTMSCYYANIDQQDRCITDFGFTGGFSGRAPDNAWGHNNNSRGASIVSVGNAYLGGVRDVRQDAQVPGLAGLETTAASGTESNHYSGAHTGSGIAFLMGTNPDFPTGPGGGWNP